MDELKSNSWLGGLNHFYFHPIPVEDSHFGRAYFSDGLKLNHQLVENSHPT